MKQTRFLRFKYPSSTFDSVDGNELEDNMIRLDRTLFLHYVGILALTVAVFLLAVLK